MHGFIDSQLTERQVSCDTPNRQGLNCNNINYSAAENQAKHLANSRSRPAIIDKATVPLDIQQRNQNKIEFSQQRDK
jgi:hypothetical protein